MSTPDHAGATTTRPGRAQVRPERASGQTSVPPGAGRPPEERGTTRIADRVLERIAGRALTEVEHAGGVARRVLGVPLAADDPTMAPRVEAHVDGHLAQMRMTVSVLYPQPVRQVVGRIREHVMHRVGDLTGLDVRQVDIEVAGLVKPTGH